MTDQEIVDGLINRDEKITDWFFNIKYRPLFINVIKLIGSSSNLVVLLLL